MFLVGLSGGIATGKSTVSSMLKQQGIPIIDADEISRKVVEVGSGGWRKVRVVFGEEYFHPETGAVDREKLGSLVFRDPQKRKQLNRRLHPFIRWEMAKQCLYYLCAGYAFVVLDVPLLFETGLNSMMQKTIVVFCDKDVQMQRLMERDGFSVEEAQSRIDAQLSLDTKCAKATYLIDNGKSIHDTEQSVSAIVQKLQNSRLHYVFRFIFLTIAGSIVWYLF